MQLDEAMQTRLSSGRMSSAPEDALELLSEKQIVELDEERKATMVSNLLVVLTSEQQTTPIVNAGSIY